ncbi:MAG: radical SAM protein [Acidobacteriota bacterium]
MKIERVTLIEPKSSSFNIYTGTKILRLGLPIISSILKEMRIESKIYYEEISEIDWEEIKKSDLVGISTITSTSNEAYQISDRVKSLGIPVVMGGAHVTFLPDEALEHCDFVIRGEGEETIRELISALRNDGTLETIKGLSYKNELGRIVHNPLRPLITDLDKIPSPDFSSIVNFKKIHTIPVYFSRGCPYLCEFCSVTSLFGRKIRIRNIENVISDIKKFYPERKNFFFIDDNFVIDPEKTKELLKKIKEENLKIKWSAQIRVDAAKDEELLKIMKESGCVFVYVGFESINPESLKGVKKNQLVSEYKNTVKKLRRHKINVHGMFVFGFDEDDESIFSKTLKYVLKIKMTTIQFLILCPIPGSNLYKILKERARILSSAWNRYDGHFVVFKPLKVSAYKLQTETIKAMKKFYSLPQIIKLFLKIRFSKNYFTTIFLRIYGNILVRKWIRNDLNKNYIKHLKESSS